MRHGRRCRALLQAVAAQESQPYVARSVMTLQHSDKIQLTLRQRLLHLCALNRRALCEYFTRQHFNHGIFLVRSKAFRRKGILAKRRRTHAALQCCLWQDRLHPCSLLPGIAALIINCLRCQAFQIIKDNQVGLPARGNRTQALQAINTRRIDACQTQRTHRLHT